MPQLPTYVAHVVRVGADCAFDEKKYYTEFRISSTVKRSRYRTFNSIRLGEGKSFADGGAGPLATFSSRLNSHVLTLASYDTSDTSTPPHRPYTLTACPAALFAECNAGAAPRPTSAVQLYVFGCCRKARPTAATLELQRRPQTV